jgi:hypothetical protein
MRKPSLRWVNYSAKTGDCIPLDRDAYPLSIYEGRPVPWPDWACKAPDGGIHFNASLATIDVQVAKAPSGRDELTWTCEFILFVLARRWFAEIEDLVDPEHVGIGSLFLGPERLKDWVVIFGRRPPPLRSAEGWEKSCPICGNPYSLIRGREFFSDPEIEGRALIVSTKGICVREDEVSRRNLRAPVGAFRPRLVELRDAASS